MRRPWLREPAAPSDRCAEPALPIRPPGALPEAAFVDACHRCGACIDACPHQSISFPGDEFGAGAPHVDTRRTPCQLCEGLQCTTACPSGALSPVVNARTIFMGTAVIDEGQCLAYRGAPCRACYDVCPLPGVLELAPGAYGLVPVAGLEHCVGCGMCDRYCPAPAAIRIVPPNADGPTLVRVEPRSTRQPQ
jgi:MauM/NapG family ferredoxin protein